MADIPAPLHERAAQVSGPRIRSAAHPAAPLTDTPPRLLWGMAVMGWARALGDGRWAA